MFNISSAKFINAHSLWLNDYTYFCAHLDQVLLTNEFRSGQVFLNLRHWLFEVVNFAYISTNIYEHLPD